jgi:DNA primase
MIGVATFGMHLSSGPDGQIAKFVELKKRGLKVVTMMWDSEKKAMIQAVTAGLALMSMGLKVQIAQLPTGCDPAQDADGNPLSPEVVRQAIFRATHLDRLSAIRLTMAAGAIK